MVWRAMSASVLSQLHIVPQGTSVKANYYIHNIVELVLLPVHKRRRKSGGTTNRKMFNRRSELVFMQNTAPAHTARVTQHWCTENLFIHPHPPNSPDLTPIEKCWRILNSRVFHTPPTTTMEQLNARAKSERKNIESSTLKNLVHSVPERLQAVIREKGGYSGF